MRAADPQTIQTLDQPSEGALGRESAPPLKPFLRPFFVIAIDEILTLQHLSQRIILGAAIAKMQVSSPPFRMLELPGHLPRGKGHVFHNLQIGVESLAGIQPGLLALMLSQRLSLGRVNRLGVHKSANLDRHSQLITEPVRHAVINGYLAINRTPLRPSAVIRHASRESSSDRQAAGASVILHVILRRVGKQYPRIYLSDYRCNPFQKPLVVEDFQIVSQTEMKLRAHQPRGSACFQGSYAGRLEPIGLHAAAIAVSNVEIVNLVTRFLKKEQRSGHPKFDIVRMGTYG